MTTSIDYLVIGNHIVRKKSHREITEALLTLVPALASSRKLVKGTGELPTGLAQPYFAIESGKSRFFTASSREISPEMFHVLQGANGHDDFHSLIRLAGVAGRALDSLKLEIMDLWSKRILLINPPCPTSQSFESAADASSRLGLPIAAVSS